MRNCFLAIGVEVDWETDGTALGSGTGVFGLTFGGESIGPFVVTAGEGEFPSLGLAPGMGIALDLGVGVEQFDVSEGDGASLNVSLLTRVPTVKVDEERSEVGADEMLAEEPSSVMVVVMVSRLCSLY